MSADTCAIPAIRATWYCWLLTGFYLYSVNLQGNVVPFLQAEFALSYRAVSLHSSAIAVGIILVGLLGDRVEARLGRRRTLWLGIGGLAGGSTLLCLAPAPWASISACFLMGALGGLLPAIVPAVLADLHGPRRAEAYAGQAIVAYAFGLAAPLLAGAAIWAELGWRAAVLIGVAAGIAIGLGFRRMALPEVAQSNATLAPAVAGAQEKRALPPAYWAYWALLIAACALEFLLLFWVPSYLERIIGFEPAAAATASAGFPLGMLIGRIALRTLVARVALRLLLIGALALTFVGFLIYWGVSWPPAAVAGTFVIGLGIAPLYPLVTDFAIGAAPASVPGARDRAAMRLAIAFGLALLLAPIALGALADEAGLGPAHLALPALIILAYASFFIGQALERRAALAVAQ
jgi:predicted MFS family arabinose efflux permease